MLAVELGAWAYGTEKEAIKKTSLVHTEGRQKCTCVQRTENFRSDCIKSGFYISEHQTSTKHLSFRLFPEIN